MPSLIGTAPNQVPVNAMLGSAAYQDVNNFAVETKASSDNSDFAASTKFVKENSKQSLVSTLTSGTGSAYILSPVNAPVEYYDGQTFNVKFHTPCGNAPTINVSGLGAKNLVYANMDGSFSNLAAADITPTAGNVFTASIRYNGVAFEVTTRRQAWSTEASTGTNTNHYLTPASLRHGLNASGAAPIYACRAWVNFNGTGTVAIRASGNVTSITDNGTGNYTVNFTTALPTGDYAVVATSGGANTAYSNVCTGFPSSGARDGSAIQVLSTAGGGSSNIDVPFFSVAVFC